MAEKKKSAGFGDNPDTEEKPKDSELGTAIGVDYNLPFTTPFYDPTRDSTAAGKKKLNELLRESWEDHGPSVKQLVTMRRMDGQARALYRLLTLPIRGALAKSVFKAAPGGEKEAEFITQMFTLPPAEGGMTITFSRFMSQLLQALFDGFAPFEQVYDVAKHGPLKGKYVLKKLAYRPSETINFVVDDNGSFQGFRQRANVNGKNIDVWIPRDRAFYYAAQEEERQFYGVSFFQSAFYHYDKKIKTYYIAHLAAQRTAVGTRVGTFPQSATTTQKSEFNAHLANLALAQWISVPENFKVETLKEGGTFPFLDYINHHNSQMSKSILAQFFDKDDGGNSNEKVVDFSKPDDKMFMVLLRSIMDDIAASINHYIIPRLIDWNFDSGKYPTFQWADLSDEQKAAIYSVFDKLATAGQSANVTPEFMRELEKHMAHEMNIEIDWEAIEDREEAERALLQAQQEVAAASALGLPTNSEEAAVSEFENAAASGGGEEVAEEPEEEDVQLTDSERLMFMKLAGGQRRVQTQAGVEKYKSPIGSVIIADAENQKKNRSSSGVTVPRLLSLHRLVEAAKSTGNLVAEKEAREDLLEAVKEYTGPNSTPSKVRAVLNALTKVGGEKDDERS